MNLSIYYVDAFTDKLFSGNPAAVIFSDLTNTLTMQNIAAENNLSETAFIREEGGIYYIRWFSPSCEIDLCGHATLASSYTYFIFINPVSTEFEVHSKKTCALTFTLEIIFLYLYLLSHSITSFNSDVI